MGLASFLNKNIVDMMYGGRHDHYKKILDHLFGQLSSYADLIFFEDGPVVADKYETWIRRQDDKYASTEQVLDKVYSLTPIVEIIASTRDMPTVTHHLALIEDRARAYGKLIITVTQECDAEIAKYAIENSSVIAVLADDTDFLIFGGSWRYWSIREINPETFTTMEFSRAALREHLGLDNKQLVVFSTIASNDVVKYDEVQRCHQINFGGRKPDVKFPAIAEFIKNKINMSDFNEMIMQLAELIFSDQSMEATDRIYNSISFYNTVG